MVKVPPGMRILFAPSVSGAVGSTSSVVSPPDVVGTSTGDRRGRLQEPRKIRKRIAVMQGRMVLFFCMMPSKIETGRLSFPKFSYSSKGWMFLFYHPDANTDLLSGLLFTNEKEEVCHERSCLRSKEIGKPGIQVTVR
jgi:hypothetical protein